MPDATLTPQALEAFVSTGRILIIDDEPGIRESLEVLLTLEGFQVDMAPEVASICCHESRGFDLSCL